MKKIIGLLGILIVIHLTVGCVTTGFFVQSPPVVVVDERVYYDDSVRGWYIEGYYTPTGVWIAPFWTADIMVVHRHFAHYRGPHRSRIQQHFNRYPDRFREGQPSRPPQPR